MAANARSFIYTLPHRLNVSFLIYTRALLTIRKRNCCQYLLSLLLQHFSSTLEMSRKCDMEKVEARKCKALVEKDRE